MDIVDRKRHQLGLDFTKGDFLQLRGRLPIGPFSVVCNPPFDYVEEFCRHALDLGALKVAMIMLTRSLNAAHWLTELPLRRVWFLTPRPSMPTGEFIKRVERGELDPDGKPLKVGGGKQDFCWLVIQKGYSGEPGLCWLHRDGGTNGVRAKDIPHPDGEAVRGLRQGDVRH
jgi:hypothetical protein